MEHNDLRGLIGAVGKALATGTQGGEVVEELEKVSSPEEFREFLTSRDLGISEPSRTDFVEAVTDEEAWQDWHAQLAASANMQWHEFTSPGS